MKKNGFFTFILSFIPGCGLMYLGYMKKGLQTMTMFAASIFMAVLFGSTRSFEWFMALFIALLPIIWFYQMFDSMHSIARMKRLGIEVPEDDGFFIPQNLNFLKPVKQNTAAKVFAVILILVGCVGIIFGILDNLHHVFGWETASIIIRGVRNYLAPALVSLGLIVAGAKLLKGSKPKKSGGGEE